MLVKFNKEARVSEAFLRKHHGDLIGKLTSNTSIEDVMAAYNQYTEEYYGQYFKDGEVYVVESEEGRLKRYENIGRTAPDFDGEIVSILLDDVRAVEAPLYLFDEVEVH